MIWKISAPPKKLLKKNNNGKEDQFNEIFELNFIKLNAKAADVINEKKSETIL